MSDAGFKKYVQPVGDNAMARVEGLASQQADLTHEQAKLEEQLEKVKEQLKDVSERQLPELMDELGMAEFKTTSGLEVKVEEIVTASISKANTAQAMAWLRANNFGNLIRRQIVIEVPSNEPERGDKIVQDLAGDNDVTDDEKVHSATLRKFVKDRLQKGDKVPLDIFGVHRVRKAKVK